MRLCKHGKSALLLKWRSYKIVQKKGRKIIKSTYLSYCLVNLWFYGVLIGFRAISVGFSFSVFLSPSLYSSHHGERNTVDFIIFSPLFWTILYDRYIPIQTLIITLLHMSTVPKGTWATCGLVRLQYPRWAVNLSPRYGHMKLVSGYDSGYLVLTGVDWSQHGCPISDRYTVNQACLFQPSIWRMAAMHVAVADLRTRPRAIPLAMITVRKSTHGFLFPSHMSMGLLLTELRAAGAPLWTLGLSIHIAIFRGWEILTWWRNFFLTPHKHFFLCTCLLQRNGSLFGLLLCRRGEGWWRKFYFRLRSTISVPKFLSTIHKFCRHLVPLNTHSLLAHARARMS